MSRQKNKERLRRLHRLPEPEADSGILSVTRQGFGFAATEKHGDVFIPPHNLNGAIDGDRVEVLITEPKNPMGPAGKVSRIQERSRAEFVGEMTDAHTLQPLDPALPAIRISGGAKGARKGDWVQARLLDSGSKFTEHLRCEVYGKVGKSAMLPDDLFAVVKEFHLPEPYSKEAEEKAQLLEPVDIAREDRTRDFVMTIDPPDAHDFDDAISISDHKTNWIIGVHIADVAAWIRSGTRFDKAAADRSFSSYIPGMFQPMLPKPLTARISLRENARSLAHTVELVVRKKDGAVLSHKRFHSVIRVSRRLDYPSVQDFTDTGNMKVIRDAETAKHLTMLAEAAEKMRGYRREHEQFLNMEIPEIRIQCTDDASAVTGLEERLPGLAEAMIEECMLAANAAVAEEMIEKGIPGLYRIHPDPDPDKLAEFEAFAAEILRKNPGDLSVRENLCRFLKNLPEEHTRYAALTALLRAMPRALYSADPAPHYGLGKLKYAHFTSPIRRYSDLFTHQQLAAYDMKKRMHTKKWASKIADDLIKKERRNDEAFFAAADRLKLHYLRTLLGKNGKRVMFSGVVIRAAARGLICDIPELALRGFVPENFLTPSLRKRPPRPGNLIYLCPDKLDFHAGRADFRPA